MNTRPKIGFVGLTHLGVCSAVAAAAKGFETIAFGTDAALVARLDEGQLPVTEPGLDDLLSEVRDRIAFSTDFGKLAECDVAYVAPDVPTDDSGGSDLSGIDDLLSVTMDSVRADAVIVVLSQVPPGFTRARLRPDRCLLYQVETLVFGRAVERATRPERFIVGCQEPGEPLPGALAEFLDAFDCPVLPMRLESAELAKISINCCLVASVTVANTLAEVCEGVGADWSEIVPALRLDRRIGPSSYLMPGLGIAGGNLERDLATVVGLSLEHGTDAGAIKAFLANSAHRRHWSIRTLHTELLDETPDACVGVLGLAYKENTHSVKNSASIELIGMLSPRSVQVYDPVVDGAGLLDADVRLCRNSLDAAAGTDGVAIMTPWPEFRSLDLARLAEAMRGNLVLDPFSVLDHENARRAGLRHRVLGRT